LDGRVLRNVGPTEIRHRGQWAQVTAVELEDKSR
jgi:hypothetical protein